MKNQIITKLCLFQGGWYILRDWNEEDFDPNFLLKELHVKYGATPYFQISVIPNPLFPGHSSISISPAGLGLPDRKYYYGEQDDPVSIECKTLQENCIKSILDSTSL